MCNCLSRVGSQELRKTFSAWLQKLWTSVGLPMNRFNRVAEEWKWLGFQVMR